jgi:PAS domain S-box-containing protein
MARKPIQGKPKRISGSSRATAPQPKSANGSFDFMADDRGLLGVKESAEKYRSLFMNAPVGIFQSTPAGRCLMANPTFANMYGFDSPEEMVNGVQDIAELYYDPMDRQKLKRQYQENGQLVDYEVRARRRDGQEFWISVFARYFPGSSEDTSYYDGFALDITERKKAEYNLRESERKYRNLFDLVSDSIFLIEKETGNILEVNQSACSLYGYSRDEFLTLRNVDLSAEPESTRDATLKERKMVPLRYHRKKDGTIFPVEIAASHFKWQARDVHLAVIRDITFRLQADNEKANLQKQLQQAQKMEAIGVLAGGIAHDFNNILGAIVGFIELAKINVGPKGPVDDLDQALNASKRAKDLVKQILAFSRQSDEEMMPVRLAMVVKEAAKFLRATVPATTEIRLRIEDPSGAVLANSVELHQVVMNLCTNAVHAIGNQSGSLQIEVQRATFDSGRQTDLIDLEQGAYLKLSVRDSGCGITAEHLQRIFDPYYTTKEKGVGTGLGLAVVHGIVKKIHGAIKVESEPGKGSVFHVYLPRVDTSTQSSSGNQPELPTGGCERILFVDDEKMLVELAQKNLERLGYHVVARTSPLEALELFKQKPDDFDLVITDQTMPGMTGHALAKELMNIKPNIPVIICTGYSQLINQRMAKAKGIKAFIMKPMLVNEIDAAIRAVFKKG